MPGLRTGAPEAAAAVAVVEGRARHGASDTRGRPNAVHEPVRARLNHIRRGRPLADRYLADAATTGPSRAIRTENPPPLVSNRGGRLSVSPPSRMTRTPNRCNGARRVWYSVLGPTVERSLSPASTGRAITLPPPTPATPRWSSPPASYCRCDTPMPRSGRSGAHRGSAGACGRVWPCPG